MGDSKLMLLLIIVTVFIACTTQYSQFTFENVTVHLKVSNTTHPWKKIFISKAKNVNDFIQKAETKVKVISFRKQRIPVLLKDSMKDAPRLNKIKFNLCGVEELEPGCLKNLTRISEFDVSYNKIRDIKYGVFNNMGISRLILSNNKIHDIENEAFSNMNNLEMIILSHNRLTQIDASWFIGTPVRHVDFSTNMIEDLFPGAFDYFKNFRKKNYGEFYYINFSDNVLTKLRRNVLPEVKFLWFLFLEKNFIEEIDDEFFRGIQKMEALKLGENKIRTFDNKILGEMDLRYLKLDKNELECINMNITEILNVDGNPLSKVCDKNWKERKIRDRELFDRYLHNF